MKQNGTVVFGCKFSVIPQNTDEFVNLDPSYIANAMKDAGFDVATEKVKIHAGNYLEIKGKKR